MEYTQFMDAVVKTFVPDILEKPELFDLITTFVENIEMRNININLEIFYRKDYSQPLLNHLPDTLINYILNERESILLIVKNYDDTHFDPRKQNILHLKKTLMILPVYKIFWQNQSSLRKSIIELCQYQVSLTSEFF